MESRLFVNDLGQYMNKEITGDFLVLQKELREGSRDFFIRMRLGDKSGSIAANIWNNAKAITEKFKEGDVIRVKAVVISYKSQLQLTINKVQPLKEEQYDLVNFIETTKRDVNQLSEKLFTYIDNNRNEYLKTLLKSIFDDREFFSLFARAPAAKTWHHNYAGGLIEHTITVAGICDFISHLYPVNRDLLICGALLHDIGKVYEYSSGLIVDFTAEGRLLGHIPIGDEFVSRKARALNNFPADLLMKLRHLILAHHGEYEKASARLPQTIEAVLLHHADNLDAQVVGVKQLVDRAQKSESEWTEYDRLNNRYYLIR